MKLFFLQAADTDFIAAILGEEFGFIGFSTMILFFLILFWRGLRVASRAQDMFQYYCAIGLTSLLFINFAINIGVVLKIFPTTGIPLPFISYGGSHILIEFISAGLLFNLSQYQTKVSFAGLGKPGMVRYATRSGSKVRTKTSLRSGKKYAIRRY
jgi:cell division protein FtsW